MNKWRMNEPNKTGPKQKISGKADRWKNSTLIIITLNTWLLLDSMSVIFSCLFQIFLVHSSTNSLPVQHSIQYIEAHYIISHPIHLTLSIINNATKRKIRLEKRKKDVWRCFSSTVWFILFDVLFGCQPPESYCFCRYYFLFRKESSSSSSFLHCVHMVVPLLLPTITINPIGYSLVVFFFERNKKNNFSFVSLIHNNIHEIILPFLFSTDAVAVAVVDNDTVHKCFIWRFICNDCIVLWCCFGIFYASSVNYIKFYLNTIQKSGFVHWWWW